MFFQREQKIRNPLGSHLIEARAELLELGVLRGGPSLFPNAGKRWIPIIFKAQKEPGGSSSRCDVSNQ